MCLFGCIFSNALFLASTCPLLTLSALPCHPTSCSVFPTFYSVSYILLLNPLLHAYSELDNHLSHLEECYGRYKKLYPVVDTSTHSEFLSLRRTLSKESKTVQNIVTGIKGAVDQVERYRHKFPSIRDAELSARKQYVLRAQTQLNGKSNGSAL